jgi:hypothetical protein
MAVLKQDQLVNPEQQAAAWPSISLSILSNRQRHGRLESGSACQILSKHQQQQQ